MSEPLDIFPLHVKEPEPWDRAAAPPDVPFLIQEQAIEELLRKEPDPMPIAAVPGDLAAEMSAPIPDAPSEVPAAKPDADVVVEEFKPTDTEWENVKDLLVPHSSPLEEQAHPAYRPEILERDAEGRDGGGDWNAVETERPG